MRIGRRQQFEDDMDAELRFHIDSCVADLVRSGLTPEEAKRRARIEFGSLEASKDQCRQAWGLQRLDELRADLRLTFRTIRRSPGFAAVAILSLALGIGANTAIFGMFDAVMLRLLPVRDPGRLVFVQSAGTAGRDGPPYPCFELIRDRATSFEGVSAFSPSAMELTADRGRELARGLWVSGNLYQTLGVRPLIGRTLTASDDQTPGKGGPDGAVAVISRAYWQRRFGGDLAVVGRTIYLFEHAVTIVGVMPTETISLEPGRPIDIAVPMMLSDPVKLRDRTALWLLIVARLKPSVRMEQARAESGALFKAYIAGVRISEETRTRLFDHMDLAPAAKGLGGLRRQFSKPLSALMILAGLVLLAACVNITNLMLARAMARQRDFAVRLAIGAGRGRLIRQHLTESLALVGAGAALGIVLARLGQTALAAFFAEGNNRIVLDLSLNVRMLLFTLTVAVLSGLALGIVPAMRAARLDPAAGLHGGSRGIAGNRVSLRLGRALVVVQVTLSMVLLAGAGLFIRSLRELESVGLGFAREGILTMEVTPERRLFGSSEWLAMQTDILDRVRRIPGVRSVSWATMNPLSGRDRGAVLEVPGFVPRTEADKDIHLAAVSPEYFDTLGVPMLLGRGFSARDHGGAPKVAILNVTAARFYFGNANPIGLKVRFTNYPGRDLLYEVVGVVGDARHDSLREPPPRFIYLPIPQSVDRINRLALAARCSGDAIHFAAPVRRQIQSVRSTLLIANVSTMEKQIEQSLLRERLVAALSTTFGTVALVLACIGLYGILAYAVTRRTNEIGIRMALGATKSGVVWMVLREAFALAGAGIVIALPGVLALGQITKASLYGVEPVDPIAFASAAFLLLLFTALAAALPGRRASLLNPTSALRRE
ncbi:MAG: ABC transporter permease [Acidobacteria bacterium]|nr:ABC transporter permease [Acidobacteriota bacterium]